MVRQNHQVSRKLVAESLEGRLMMAGNVSVSFNNGGLFIDGDGQANEIRVEQVLVNNSPVAGRYRVVGVNGTTLNFGTGPAVFSNVTEDILLAMNGGNDRVIIGTGINGQFIAPNDLTVSMGEGNDVLTLARVHVRDDALLITGNGSDTVDARVSVGALAGVDNGDNNLTIDTGNNVDNVILRNTFARRNLDISTGTDSFGDVVDFLMGNIGGDTIIRTFGGADIVRIDQVGFNGDLRVETGAGNDSVRILASQVDELFATLDAGSDSLELRNTSGRRATLNGGTEADTLVQSGNSFSELFSRISI